jgi:branched-chain amino acid transport system permease protein
MQQKNKLLSTVTTVILVIIVWGLIEFLTSGRPPILSGFYKLNIILLCINIILAVSLNLINGFTGQFSLGHAGFMAVGAYISAVFTQKLMIIDKIASALGMDPTSVLPENLGLLIAAAFGAAAAALIGVVIGLPTLRLRGDYLAIATLGMGEIIKGTVLNIEYVGGAAGMSSINQLTSWTSVFALTVISIVVIRNFIRSTHGRACISIRENEIASETMGINTTKYKVMAFSIGAFFAGLAGSLHAHYFYTIQPNTFNFMQSFNILVMVVLGGMGSITGSIIGAIVMTFLYAALQDFAEWRMVIVALLLIIMMLFRPQGLFGNKELALHTLGNLFGKSRKSGGEQRESSSGK